ncbi:hypothetical protein, partial [Streptomyces hygroscopicus]|uniref:hypothetical protein n=1 Tax=Streptomyces hygroscopicus TaxID=1912 RepID=UPI003681F040
HPLAPSGPRSAGPAPARPPGGPPATPPPPPLTYLSDTTERPDGLLRSLEKVRRRLRGDPDQPWLSTVCG